MKKTTILLFLWALFLCLPLFLNIQHTFPRLDTDYDSNLPVYQYIISYIYRYHSLPSTISVVASGISFWGDPLNSFLNPLLSLPMLTLGINAGLRVSILLSCFASGFTMLLLLRNFKIDKKIVMWGSLLYMSGGAFFAAVASGHVEKFLIYPLVPSLLLFSFEKKPHWKNNLGLGFVLAATVYSGDMYATWFFFLIITTVKLYYIFAEKNKAQQLYEFLIPLLLAICFALPKLLPFYLSVLPVMQRFNTIDAFKGSLQVFLFPLPFTMPFGVWFWDRPFFQRHLGFYFNWYEYFAFITPIPFLFLLRIKSVIHEEKVKILLLLLTMGMFYFSLMYSYSPFFWLFHFTPLSFYFRVPQRIVLPMTAVMIVLVTVCLESFLKTFHKKILTVTLLTITPIWLLLVDWNIQIQTFSVQNFPQNQLIQKFAKLNPQKFPVVDFAPSTQLFLIQANIPIKNYYYGWIPKGIETYNEAPTMDYVKLINEKPMYVIIRSTKILTPYGYKNILKNSTIAVWQKI